MFRTAYFAIDLILIFVASLLAVAMRGGSLDAVIGSPHHLFFAGVASLSALVVWPLTGMLRRPWRYFALSDAMHLVVAVTSVGLIALFITFIINRSDFVARSVPMMQWGLTLTLLVLARVIARHFPGARPLPDDGLDHRENILLIGFNRRSEVYLQSIEALYPGRVCVVGILDDDPSVSGLMLKGRSVIGRPAHLMSAIRRLGNHGVEISRIVVTVPKHELSSAFLSARDQLQAEGKITIDHFEGLFGGEGPGAQPVARDVVGSPRRGHEAAGIRGTLTAERGTYLAVKRSFDVVVALVMIVLLGPVYLVLAGLVAVDLGRPLTFWQERPGRFRRPFRVYKFRTMRDAYDLDGNDVPVRFRMSSIGQMLRRLRLDELPQLFNILVGNMSFVGPRPLLLADQPARLDIRLSMRPGLTGWAQINGGRDLSIVDKGALDCWYVENANLLVDLKIVILTLRFLLAGDKPPRQTVLDQAHGRRELRGTLAKVPATW